MYNDSLYHYGVKGMRWGVRRYRDYDGSTIGDRARKAGRNAAIGVGAAGALGAAALGGVAAKNPAVRKAIRRGITDAGAVVYDAAGRASKTAKRAGKTAVIETRNRAGKVGTRYATKANTKINQARVRRSAKQYNTGTRTNQTVRDYMTDFYRGRGGTATYNTHPDVYGSVRNAGLANTTKNTGTRQVRYMTARSRRNKNYY